MADSGLRRRGAPRIESSGPGPSEESQAERTPLQKEESPEDETRATSVDKSEKPAEASAKSKRPSKKKEKRPRKPPPLRWDEIFAMAMTIFTAVVTVYSTYYLLQQWRERSTHTAKSTSPSPSSTSPSASRPAKLWTAAELAMHDGSDPKLSLLLACLGEVFDVTKGKKHYGKGQSYHHFLGRDASRAFVSGNFTEDGLTDDVSKFTYDQLIGVAGWRDFYRKEYRAVGVLVGRYYNSSGLPTKNLTRFERQLKRAKEEQARREKEDKQFVGCNSYWSAPEGGKVYCESGYPRMIFSVMQTGQGQTSQRTRCVCLSEEQIRGRADLKLYDDCEEWSTSCQTSPPEKS